MLGFVGVKERIKELQAKTIETTGRTAEDVLRRLWTLAEIDTDPRDYKKRRISKTLEMLMRHYSLFNDRHELEVKQPLIVEIVKFSRKQDHEDGGVSNESTPT